MDIYIELETGKKTKSEIEKIMLDVAENLEELFTLYYVICEESNFAEAVVERISEQIAPIEKWVEIYERIPRKKEFFIIKEIFFKKMAGSPGEIRKAGWVKSHPAFKFSHQKLRKSSFGINTCDISSSRLNV